MREFVQPMIVKDSTQATIAINADKSVPLENVVAVMRIARDLGARSTLLVDTDVEK
jgi:biopolymer transport protein ExbD